LIINIQSGGQRSVSPSEPGGGPGIDQTVPEQTVQERGLSALLQARAMFSRRNLLHTWRPAGTLVFALLALLLTWHVINGKDGISIWQQKRAEDQQLQRDIQSLQGENGRLRDHISELKSDPESIEREAREKLHYAKAGEIIYTLPTPPQPVQSPSTAK